MLIQSGAEWMPGFTKLLQGKLTEISDPTRQNMIATGLIGALRPGILAGTRQPDEAEQVRSYGGDVLLAERLPEPSC